MALTRGTDLRRAHIGMDLFGPAPDFAGLARSMGSWAEGPIKNADDLQPALQRAVAQVKTRKPALVDHNRKDEPLERGELGFDDARARTPTGGGYSCGAAPS